MSSFEERVNIFLVYLGWMHHIRQKHNFALIFIWKLTVVKRSAAKS